MSVHACDTEIQSIKGAKTFVGGAGRHGKHVKTETRKGIKESIL